MRGMGRREVVALSLAVVVVAVLAIPTHSAATHDPNVIHACKQKNQGMLRVVQDPSECRPSEDPISWEIQGPAGTTPAFARVSNGSLDTTRSQNIVSMTTVSVTTSGSGTLTFYCFDLPFIPHNVVATGELEQTSFGFAFAAVGATVVGTSVGSSIPCPAGTKAIVQPSSLDSFFALFN